MSERVPNSWEFYEPQEPENVVEEHYTDKYESLIARSILVDFNNMFKDDKYYPEVPHTEDAFNLVSEALRIEDCELENVEHSRLFEAFIRFDYDALDPDHRAIYRGAKKILGELNK